MPNNTLGVLDLQGDVVEHIDHLQRIGVAARRIKKPQHLDGLAGLIIPGGESTCLWRLLQLFELDTAIGEAVRQHNLMIWGTCAGAILVANEIIGESPKLGLMDITVARNAFGTQLASFHIEVDIPQVSRHKLPLTFIRAPKILQVGQDIEVLLQIDDYIAMAEDHRVMATVFHPEMTPCLAFHRYFARKCGILPPGLDSGQAGDHDPTWNRNSWTELAKVTDSTQTR